MINLSSENWKKVDGLAKEFAKLFAGAFDEKVFGKGEIYPYEDGGLEQREYYANYYTMESELEDIIKNVLDSELPSKYTVDGFYDLVDDFRNWVSDELPENWYIYWEDGDIWVARNWDNLELLEELNAELVELVNN